MQTDLLKDYLSRDDLAARLGIATKTLVRWQNDGNGPPVTYLGRAPFYSIPSFEKWLKAQERAAKGATSINAA
jgi:hypothetical protein